MTHKGIMRQRYSHEVERNPSRFTGDSAYSEWAARADVWSLSTDSGNK